MDSRELLMLAMFWILLCGYSWTAGHYKREEETGSWRENPTLARSKPWVEFCWEGVHMGAILLMLITAGFTWWAGGKIPGVQDSWAWRLLFSIAPVGVHLFFSRLGSLWHDQRYRRSKAA